MSWEFFTAIGAFLVGVGALVSAILLNRKTMALVEYRLGKVEEKLDEHNNYARTLNKIETDIAVIKTKMEYIPDR